VTSLMRLLNSVLLIVMVSTVYGQTRPSNNLPGGSSPTSTQNLPAELKNLIQPKPGDAAERPSLDQAAVIRNHKNLMNQLFNSEQSQTRPQRPNIRPNGVTKELLTDDGGVGDGGGDPRAFEVTEWGQKALGWLHPNFNAYPQINRLELNARAEYFLISLDTKFPLIRFLDVQDLSCFNENKKGCTLEDASAEFAGLWWDLPSTTPFQKCFVSLVELLRPQRLYKVYETAAQICTTILIPPAAPTNAIQTAAPASPPVNVCEVPTMDVKRRLDACSSGGHTVGFCMENYWTPFSEKFPRCANNEYPYCMSNCKKDHSPSFCLDFCESKNEDEPTASPATQGCERPRQMIRERINACIQGYGSYSSHRCLPEFWPSYARESRQCAKEDYKYCYDTCLKTFGSYHSHKCVKSCDSGEW
jgi:hypothetical protein